jgi:WD40 repeat protein
MSSVGEITGHSKTINSVDTRPKRPFKAITGSDDMSVNVHSGVPYKFSHSIHNHSRFVQVVRYAPNGDFFASAGSDGHVYTYSAAGEDVNNLTADSNPAHAGSVFGLAWNTASSQIATASADGTVKLWDLEKRIATRYVNGLKLVHFLLGKSLWWIISKSA